MASVLFRDQSRAGHVLGGATVDDLPDEAPLGVVIEARVRAEVATYNGDLGPVYRGLVAPEDAIRHSDGLRMTRPRPLDADRFVTAVHQAVAAGLVRFRIGDDAIADLATPVDLAVVDEIVVEMDRPVVARRV